METRFANMTVGAVDCIQGSNEATNIPYYMWGMKETKYIMHVMATGGALLPDGTCKNAT